MQTEETLERRIVTVLFADLVGFTTLSEQFDAEDVAAIQDRYFAADYGLLAEVSEIERSLGAIAPTP